MASRFRFGHPPGGGGRRRRLRRFLFRHQAHEDVLQAHAHGPHLEQAEAGAHDGGGQLAAHVGALLAVHLEHRRAVLGVGHVHADHPAHALQRPLHVPGRALRLHVHRDHAVHPLGERLRRVDGHHLALVDDHHLLARLRHLGQDVRAEDDGVRAGELANELPRLDDLLGVEARRGLVEHQHLGVVDDGLREAHALPVALREAAALPVGHVGHPGALHHLVHATADVLAHALDLGDKRQVLANRHVGVERRRLGQVARAPLGLDGLLEHVVAGHGGGAGRGGHVARDDAHRRGLAGAVGAQEPKDLARLGAEAHVIDGREGAVAFR